MPRFTRAQLQDGFAHYKHLREEASRTGDWAPWGRQFSEDARYIECAYGEFHGRAAIVDWIVKVMSPFPHMTFPDDWVVVDPDAGCVVFQCQNRLEHPTDPQGAPFQFPTWSKLEYAGEQLWSLEHDMYNPKSAADAIQAWLRAGGRFRTPELVKMKHA
jgi:SnoaL-like domain